LVSTTDFRYIPDFKVPAMAILNHEQRLFFEEQGYLLVEDAVSGEQLAALREQFATWIQESKSHQVAYGETLDGRGRFDLELGHSADKPALRRVNAPTDISNDYYQVMRDSLMTDCVAELIGPNVKFHHSKINSKLPGAATTVKWHQDFPFTPHSNDDLVTALLMVDEVTAENGPLQVLPGSHRGEIYDLWHDGVFTGAVDDAVTRHCVDKAVTCTGKAGSVCLMHTRLLHGSSPNLSARPRTLFIAVYSAEDAVPCTPNPVPSHHQGEIVRGVKTNHIRSCAFDIPLPQLPKTASFFDQQAQ
jgi:ectoine hydroxylase-related dioxygenase (phytanoyl-CoA dioxygenase family)